MFWDSPGWHRKCVHLGKTFWTQWSYQLPAWHVDNPRQTHEIFFHGHRQCLQRSRPGRNFTVGLIKWDIRTCNLAQHAITTVYECSVLWWNSHLLWFKIWIIPMKLQGFHSPVIYFINSFSIFNMHFFIWYSGIQTWPRLRDRYILRDMNLSNSYI